MAPCCGYIDEDSLGRSFAGRCLATLPGHDAKSSLTLRPYSAADEDAAIELWRRTWQKHYPHLNFTERVPWWRERWRKELVPVARVVVAEDNGALIGFVTVDPETMYLDQIVVATEYWGSNVALGAARRGQAAFRRKASSCWSTRTTRAPSASTRSTDLNTPARTKTRCRASR